MIGKLTHSRGRIMLLAIAGYIVAGAVCTAVMWAIYPDALISYALPMAGLFIAAGAALTLVLGMRRIESDAAKISGVYLAARVVKLLLTIGALLLCVYLTPLDRKTLMVGVLIFYLIFMLFDLYVFTLFTKKAGRKNAV